MSTDILELYNKDGYVIMKNIIPISRINAVLESVFKQYCKYSDNEEGFESFDEPWNTELFHQKLISFRKSNPELFGAIYDTLKTNLALMNLVSDDNVTNCVSKLFDMKPSDFSVSDQMVRLDVPEDVRNIHGWHQERSFFPQNRSGLNGLVCWVPLNKATKENGAIHICVGSHKEGLLSTKREGKRDGSYTTQISVPEDYVKKYEDIMVETNVGDAVFFNMLLFHKSGKNISNELRFTIQSRYHMSTADDFIPYEFINYYNPFVKQKLLENNFDCSDIPDNKRQPPVV